MGETDDPHREYTRLLELRRSEAVRHDRRHRLYGNLRLLVGLSAVVLLGLAWRTPAVAFWWLLAPAGVFAILAARHDSVLRRKAVCERAAAYFERALKRLDHRWAGTGEPGDRYRDPAHPYAEDLDLFGKASLFELLSTARTRMGEDLLASWLLAPAPPATVGERQAAVSELRPRVDLREDLAVLDEEVRSDVHPDRLAAWGEQPPVLGNGWERAAAAVLAVLALGAGVVWAVSGFRLLFFAVAGVEALYYLRMRRRVDRVVGDVEDAAHDLVILARVLGRLERERFSSPLAARLRGHLDVEGAPASRRIARLQRIMELLDSRDHVLMRVVGPFLLYTSQIAFAVESWRRQSGPAVRSWLEAVGEIEALTGLAGYAWEHPADPFPEFVSSGACLEAQGIAHPLLPDERAIRNDVALGGDLRVLIVSGSNMSGKSTLLRTLGVNVVLAQAGAPVRARSMRLSPLQPGASIRVTDSLESGISRFYAEITRLRRIVDLTRLDVPVLFLLDEFLHGTNSHDRKVGAEAIVRGLVDRGALGLVTTHDLALAYIADALAPRGDNVHFEDRLEDGKLLFDYRLRSGVVQKSNALELMRSIGLEV